MHRKNQIMDVRSLTYLTHYPNIKSLIPCYKLKQY